MRISVERQSFPLRRTFAISRESRNVAQVLVATVEDSGFVGRGECVPYKRYGESVDSVARQILSLPTTFDRCSLQEMLPPGAARNALDCALWDLEAKQSGKRVWELAGLPAPGALETACTIPLGSAAEMGEAAAEHAERPVLKIKLGSRDDLPRLEAVRDGAPDARLIADANEGWSAGEFLSLSGRLAELGVEMVEQPLPAGDDDPLLETRFPFALCADESCHDRDSLPKLRGKYCMVNIKLDKTGGLTEAIALRKHAESEGFRIMVGCMVGTSLGMAPAALVAQGAEIVDLDGPLLLAEDRAAALRYEGSSVHPPSRDVWG